MWSISKEADLEYFDLGNEAKNLKGFVFADKGFISQQAFEQIITDDTAANNIKILEGRCIKVHN